VNASSTGASPGDGAADRAFTLEGPEASGPQGEAAGSDQLPIVRAPGDWAGILLEAGATPLANAVSQWMRDKRWFRGKARVITTSAIRDVIPLPAGTGTVALTFLHVEYRDGDGETYSVPLALATGERAARVESDSPASVVARIALADGAVGIVHDAFIDADVIVALLEQIAGSRRIRARGGELIGTPTPAFQALRGTEAVLPVTVSRAEQSNSSAILGDRLILKLFRRLESGINPDLEVTRFLTERGFPNIAALAGFVVHRGEDGESSAVALAQQFVPNEGDVWALTLDRLDDFAARAAAADGSAPPADTSARALLASSAVDPPGLARRMIGPFLDTAGLLGTRTAELHRALSGDPDHPDFAPQPFTLMVQRSLYQSLRNQARQTFLFAGRAVARLPADVQAATREVMAAEDQVDARYRALLGTRLTGQRIRVHGDLHAGQVLDTGRDVVIIDFEGEPARPQGERRRRRSALVDVAGMLRSFHYAAYGLLRNPAAAASPAWARDRPALEPWIHYWYQWVAATFLRGYRQAAGDAIFVPKTDDEFARLLDAFLLEKAIYELSYELNNRPDWVGIPLHGIRELLAR